MAPSGEQFEINGGGHRAVVTESGAALRGLWAGDRSLVDGFGPDEQAPGGRGQVLVPWPNRIRDGRYSLDGADLQLALTEPRLHNASHGLVRWAAWRAVDHTDDAVTMAVRIPAQTGYPWTLDVSLTYALADDGLRVTHSATNRATSPAPYAAGMHPYLVAGSSPLADWEMTFAAGSRLETDDRLLPTATVPVPGTSYDASGGRPVGGLVLNHAFTDLARDADGIASLRLWDPRDRTGVELWADEKHRWFQLYTGDDSATRPRGSVAVEPMTAPPDAFNSGTDLVRLAPGETFTASWGIRALT